MCRDAKRFLKAPPFLLPAVTASRYTVCRGPNQSRKRHSIKEIWQQDKQAIVIVCDRATGRLHTLVTTGGNIFVACFYHMVSTKGERYLFIAMSTTIGSLFQRCCFSDDLTLHFTVVCNTGTLKWTWKSKGQPVSACVCVCVASLLFTPRQTSPGPVAHLTSQVWNMQKARWWGESYIQVEQK